LKQLIFTVFLLGNLAFAQVSVKLSSSISWKSDTSMEVNLQSTNYQKEQLINLKIVNNSPGYQQFQVLIDSFFVGKGISIFKKGFDFNRSTVNPYADSVTFAVSCYSVVNRTVIHEQQITVFPKVSNWAVINVTDSSITLPSKSRSIVYSIQSSNKADSLDGESRFYLMQDTLLQWHELIRVDPLKKRNFQVLQRDEFDNLFTSDIWYKDGKFYQKEPISIESDSMEKEEQKAIQFSGNINLESNFFSARPQHSNGAQYPFSSIQANNSISVYGIPFTLVGSHNTNDNISPNFRNFFSLQFDAESFRNNMEQKLAEELELGQFTPAELKNELSKNKMALEKLRSYENIGGQFNLEGIDVDSLLSNEFTQAKNSIRTDSILGLDSLTDRFSIPYEFPEDSLLNPPAFSNDSLIHLSNLEELDSLKNKGNQNLSKIKTAIEHLERSSDLKRRHLESLKSTKSLPAVEQLDANELFSKFQSGSLNSILLRFNKLEIGNFYEYTGEYSIRDVELEGVNLSFLINKSNSLSVLHGKVNDFQSFNLDDITDRKKISSLGWNNSKYSFFKPTMRVTRVADETVNPEISNTVDEYFITSLNAEGEVSSWANYVIEYNTSSTAINPLRKSDNQESKNSAYFLKTYITPLSFLDVKLQFDRVGSNYRSDGVYFLNRNFQAYTIGGKIRLFKNKIHLKNDFTIQERNFEQKELTNRTQKQFYDFGTHFKRLPNLQVSYSPISIEVANRIDTSFSGINANTNVLIARIFYFKKIKKTLISTALVYNQIENELADDFSTQKGIQHFASISNEKTNFSFTSSYEDDFSAIRFVSTSFVQKIGKKLQFNTHMAKNFRNDFYSEIIRTGFNLQLNDRFNLGAGGIFLIERATSILNSGGSVSLRINY
jgi:hypothetical protein